jgi:histidyl-tRNA synthetase
MALSVAWAGSMRVIDGEADRLHPVIFKEVESVSGSMPAFQRLKGFRDFLPREQAARREVYDRIESVLRRYGFREIDLPALESLDLYLVKSGEELVEQTYSFEDKGGRDVTMTPEQTPSRTRILADRKDLSKPVKWYSTSKRWRYENPQKGRLREFYQTDIDIFGADTVQADAEILAVTVDIMDALDVLDAVELLVNDRRLLEDILELYGIEATAAAMQAIDDKEKMTADEFRDELMDRGLSADDAATVDEITDVAAPVTDAIDRLEDLLPDDDTDQAIADEQPLERMKELRDALDSYGVADTVTLDLSIVRGLAYYTGLVFEVFDTAGELRAVCGGGRYDELVELFGGESLPAVGLAIGDAVLEELMRREGVWPAEELATDVYVLPVSDDVRNEALTIVNELRADGCIVETDVKERNVGGQFDYADTVNAEQVVVVGKRDLADGNVTVKDMASGSDEQVARDAVAAIVLERLEA